LIDLIRKGSVSAGGWRTCSGGPYPHQPQPHSMVHIAPFAVPLQVRLEPHLSSIGWHILSNEALSTLIEQFVFPAQHWFTTSLYQSSQLFELQPNNGHSATAKPTANIDDLIELIVFPFVGSYFTLRHF
jgi:hypothetical protein